MIMRRKIYTLAAVMVVLSFISISVIYPHIEGICPTVENSTFLQVRESILQNDTSFQKNNSWITGYYPYNFTAQGFGTVKVVLLSMNQISGPVIFNKTSGGYGDSIPEPSPVMNLVFIQLNNSVFSDLEFKVTNVSVKSSQYYFPGISHNYLVMQRDNVNSINGTGKCFLVGANTPTGPPLKSAVHDGIYKLYVTLEFYRSTLGIPFPVKSVIFSIPYEILTG